MAESFYTGGSAGPFSFSFKSYQASDVKVSVDGVDKTVTTHYTISNYTTSGGGQITFTSGNVPTGAQTIRIYRLTDVAAMKATFAAGSSIKSEDLNNNFEQLRLAASDDIGPNDISNDAITSAKIAANAVDSEHYVNGSIDTEHIADAQITTAKIASDAVNGSKIADNSINSEHYVDGSIDTAHIADQAVTQAKIANNAVATNKIQDGAITSAKYATGSIGTTAIIDESISTGKLANGAVGSGKIADDAVTTAKISDQAVTQAKIANDSVATNKIQDGAVTNAKLADAELQELATMGGNTASALADLTQSEVQILDGATVTTAELNILDGVTATATELNQLDGNTLKTTGTDFTSASQFPAASEIDARITARIDPLGGFEAIADEDSFPATAPPAGTVISIANANSLAVNSSGVGAGTRAGGSDAVVINGFPSTFNSTSLDDGIGLLVIATSTAHTYDFHRVVAKNEDVRQLSSDINDFKARYRIGSSNPTTDNDAGDLFFNTGTSKMLVYNATSSAWEEVQAVGDFFINTLSSSSGTGGGSATFNGTAYRFTLSNAPTYAQQLLVSINGVVQKPNSGTSQPSEGFAIDGGDIILAAAPATGSNAFFITIGSSVGIGTPSDNTISTAKIIDGAVTTAKLAADAVTSAKIADGTIVNADVNASAAIAGTKISPNFGSQNVVTTGSAGIGTTSPVANTPLTLQGPSGYTDTLWLKSIGTNIDSRINFGPTGTGIAQINNATGTDIAFQVSGSEKLRIDSAGHVGIGRTPFTSAGYPLQIRGNSQAYLSLSTSSQGDTALDGLVIGTDNSSAYIFQRENAPLSFWTNDTERMRIDSSGRLLINTTNGVELIHGVGGGLKLTRNKTGNPTSGQSLMSVGFHGIDDTNSNVAAEAKIEAFAAENHSGSTAASDLRFYTKPSGTGPGSSPTERMTIKANGQVGIGVTAPSAALEINDPSSGDTYLRLSGLSSNTTDANYAGIEFYNTDSSGVGPGVQAWIEARAIGSTGAGGDLVFGTYPSVSSPEGARGIERMRISGDSYIRLTSDAGGIQFNGDTAAANALDDYEEGAWTPVFDAGITNVTYNATEGEYTKIGNVVHFACRINGTGSTNGSHLKIGGLPYTQNNDNALGVASLGYINGLVPSSDQVFALVGNNSNQIHFYNIGGQAFGGNSGNGISGRTLHLAGHYHI